MACESAAAAATFGVADVAGETNPGMRIWFDGRCGNLDEFPRGASNGNCIVRLEGLKS